MQVFRIIDFTKNQVRAPGFFHSLIIAERHHLVACRMVENVGMRVGTTGFPAAIGQAILLEGLLHRLQFRLRYIARHRAILEVFDHTRPEALVERAIVLTTSGSQFPFLVALLDVLRGIGQELLAVHAHHGKACLTTVLGRVLEQLGLYLILGKRLFL